MIKSYNILMNKKELVVSRAQRIEGYLEKVREEGK